ncbi:cation transporter [Dichotomocladium elegans]|nr:cation transporter [Dichotomocladium elegans]
MSSYNNLGLAHLDASLVPFKNAPFPLILTIILILVGNTAYAILLRFIIWVLYKCTPSSQSLRRETFRYLLDHPRRCYTLLFPSTQTWWLLIVLITITIAEVVCFIALDFWLPVLQDLPWPSRFLDGFFQSVATRNAGFSVVGIGDLNPGTQLVYIVAMYISVYPVAISMRNSNVYQERALGIYRGEDEEKMRRPDFFVLTQIQRQLTSDICWVIAGIFCICVIESAAIIAPSPITMGTVIYECVSAFANVGGSTGYPNTSTSQAGQYHTLSKLVLIALMYRGRHRGLPSAIDRAILLPSEQLEQQEVEDQILKRRNTSLTNQSSNIPNVMFYSRSSTL